LTLISCATMEFDFISFAVGHASDGHGACSTFPVLCEGVVTVCLVYLRIVLYLLSVWVLCCGVVVSHLAYL